VDSLLRRSCRGLALVAVATLSLPNDASAQPRRTELVLFGTAGMGGMHSNTSGPPLILDGFLLAEPIAGVGAGVRIADHIQIESAMTIMPYEDKSGFIGSAIAMTVRGLYLSRDASSRLRPFAGAGLGFGRHSGQSTQHTIDLSGRSRRETTTFHRDGLAAEAGGGAEVAISQRVWIRFDGWLAVLRGNEAFSGIGPVLMMPRGIVNVGVRF
jgi:hypothetical protein